MDEGLLNDLLECSVCLERLDTSSRVLPCQHTFCLKCLKVIVESHKELRCPECRVLVETKVEELPPNVLLMRILEGMRNSAPRKAGGTQRAARALQITKMQQGIMQLRDGKPVPPHARAMHDYSSKEMGDLSFKKGETIILQKKLDPHWYHGECSGRSGIFPITYVQIIVPLPVPTALCKALYDFRMSAPDEEGCLAFDKGTIITVHRRVDENWAEGRVDHRVGIFPIAFVELNQAAGHLMNSAPLNRVVPPIPDQARAHSEHRHHTQHPHRYQPMTSSLPAQNPYQNVPALGPARHYQPQFVPHVGAAKPEMGPTGIAVPVAGKRTDYDRIRGVKFEYNTTIQQSNYQPAHCPAVSSQSDSSSSVNTPSGSTTTPNTSSDTSTCESVPSSPDNNTNNTMNSQTNDETNDLNNTTTAVAILNLNESSTATNTSLNVSLPPTESPKMNASTSNSVQHNDDSVTNESVTNDSLTNNEPCSSRSGPDSLLTFGKGLQAVLLSQKEGYSRQLYRDKEKRHSLTPSTHLHGNHSTQNRHSAEILATSLLDGAPASELRTERSRRRRERSLPAAYVAIYPYKPQKPDELELKKGSIYTVTERCRDGWYKGWADRSQRTGVFPGNYVAPHADKVSPRGAPLPPPPPDAPPRADTPHAGQPLSYPWSSQQQSQSLQTTPRMEKPKDKPKPDKSGVSLMKRLAAMKKCKSPPPAYSLDNPVFDDGPHEGLMSLPTHQHVRSGSCPSQLLRALPANVTSPNVSAANASTANVSAANVSSTNVSSEARRLKGVSYVTHLPHRSNSDSPWQSQHRKSQSLDVTVSRRDRHHAQTVKERFRCIVPYPPNSEYELELKLDDIVIVSKKRADGWYKGTLQRTGRTGLFPASFVQSYQE